MALPEIISKARAVTVSQNELNEIRDKKLSWFKYTQERLTRNHADAIHHMTRFSRR